MVRAPCCEKTGLKKGSWTSEEDQLLISYIQQNGHANWRALPKLAGLLRCGKSCRLRWTNYLRPDIKRGNFSKEEEETILQLHEMLGNRWSAMAAKLPGRTDNEIKNVWHTHIKKRLKNYQSTRVRKGQGKAKPDLRSGEPDFLTHKEADSCGSLLPQSPSELSSIMTAPESTFEQEEINLAKITFYEIDNSVWPAEKPGDQDLQVWLDIDQELQCHKGGDGKDFWYNLYVRAEELLEF